MISPDDSQFLDEIENQKFQNITVYRLTTLGKQILTACQQETGKQPVLSVEDIGEWQEPLADFSYEMLRQAAKEEQDFLFPQKMQKNGSYQAVFSVDLQTIQFSFHTFWATCFSSKEAVAAKKNPLAGAGTAD